MSRNENTTIEVTCPCCGAKLTVDMELGKVIAHQPPPKTFKAPDFDRAHELLENEKARRESIFNQSAEDEKVKSRVLDRKFEEALKKTKDEPITRPMRDIDLD
ncbi:MAG TPA: hypothetical protein VKV95_13740 [Terriglobia bacterium]|nr:hypothetical protein [Terriglobia bacterium]